MFWKTVKPMLSNESVYRQSIALVKDNKTLSEKRNVAETFNVFFLNIVNEMNIPLGRELLTEADHIEDPVLKIIERFKNHPSVVIIFEIQKENSAFSFKHLFVDEITKEIKSLDGKKASQDTSPALF